MHCIGRSACERRTHASRYRVSDEDFLIRGRSTLQYACQAKEVSRASRGASPGPSRSAESFCHLRRSVPRTSLSRRQDPNIWSDLCSARRRIWGHPPKLDENLILPKQVTSKSINLYRVVTCSADTHLRGFFFLFCRHSPAGSCNLWQDLTFTFILDPVTAGSLCLP